MNQIVMTFEFKVIFCIHFTLYQFYLYMFAYICIMNICKSSIRVPCLLLFLLKIKNSVADLSNKLLSID